MPALEKHDDLSYQFVSVKKRSFHSCSALLSILLAFVAGTARAQTVSVWLTTHDQSKLLQQQASVTFAAGTGGTNCILVDETQLYQQVEGFGAAFTDTTGYILNQVATPSARTNALLNLFTRNGGGIGLSFMRIPMGASDLARFHYSYDDLPAGQTDTNLTLFSIAHDQADIIPLVQQARQLNPQLKLMANPWSPPGWMKTSGSMIGGSLLPSMYPSFANYFVRFLQAYQTQGILIDYISLQNEPLYVPGDYPGMSMDAATQTTVLRDYVLPALATNHLAAKALIYDHNWDGAYYPDTVLSDAALRNSPQVAGIAWHGYGGNVGVMTALAGKYPDKGNYETEHSGGTWVGDQLLTDFDEIIHVMRSWGKAFVKWNLAGDQNYGPHAGGCATCRPLVSVNTSSGYANYTIEFYTLGHFSKFVLPGAYRVYSANAAGIVTAAFLNPDGSKALVAFNDAPASVTFQVQWGDRSFSYTLPSNAGATFTWTGTQNGTPAFSPTNQIRASSCNSVYDLQTEPTSDTLGGYDLGYANPGSYAVYENLNFASGFANVSARLASAGSGGTLEFRLDSPTGYLVGSTTVPVTGGWQTWQTVSGLGAAASGVHDLYVVFKGSSGIGNLNWFQFSGSRQPLPAPWTTADLGTVGLAGATSYSDGTFTVNGSGDDIWNAADAFRFVQQPASGVCDIRARVASVQNTDPWAKAGVMLRESTNASARNVAVLITPGNGVTFQIRTSPGGTTTSTTVGGIAAPRWVRLARTASNSFAGYYSADGANWIQIGANTSLSLSNTLLAGLTVTAHNNSSVCSAMLDNVSLNQAPNLAAISNQTILAGRVLAITNSATDADVPAQTLAFSLLSPPAGAGVAANTGLFTWRPAIAQSPSTQTVTVVVSDSGLPVMSATQSFLVTVTQPALPALTVAPVTNNNFGFWINGDAGPDYMIQVSTNLKSWQPVVTLPYPALPCFWPDTNSAGAPMQFYRVLLGP
jgi:glucosylceramidase